MSLLDQLQREGWLRAVDHALARTLRRLDPDTPDEVLVAAALASRALAFGHGALPLTRAYALFAEIAPDRDPPDLPHVDAWRTALLTSRWVTAHSPLAESPSPLVGRAGISSGAAASLRAPVGMQADGPGQGLGRRGATSHSNDDTSSSPTPLVLDGTTLYLRRYWHYEIRLTTALTILARDRNTPIDAEWCEQRLDALFPARIDDRDDAQATAARRLLESHLLLLVGGPGTGKTTTVARALLLRLEHALRTNAPLPRIALAAPTGKAAARLAEALRENLAPLRAANALDPRIDAALPPQAHTLHRLLGWRADSTAFRHDAQHPLPYDLVVVDEASMVDLPLMCKLAEAVAPHATLLLVGDRDQLPSVETGDVLAALGDAADAGGLLAARRIALTRSWRQRSAPDLARLATWVRNGDADAALDALQRHALADVTWRHGGTRDLHALLATRAVPAFRALQHAPSPAAALLAARGLRVLSAVREGPDGSHALNAWLAATLQPTGTRAGALFHGALVMITRNSYRHALYNGDVGIAWSEPDGSLRVWFEREGEGDDAGDTLRAWLPAALPEHELAFALTVHKAQGSEFDEVVLVLPAAASGFARALSREGLYTGLTRARRSLALFADTDALRSAIAQRAQRWSGLGERLASKEATLPP
jgi:exodeoxyribonuclease V alpha subunit